VFVSGCASVLFLALAQPAPSALPKLQLDSFPPPTRAAIARPYALATAHPDDVNAVGALARALHAWEQWNAAHDTYVRAHALAPRSFEWVYLDGVVLQRLARQREAAASFEQAGRLRPDYLPARLKLADALLESGDLDASARLFEALAGEASATPAAEFGLGRIDAARGRHETAIDHFERAIALFPEFAAAHYAVAQSYRAVGRRADAQAAIARHQQYGARWPGVDDPVLTAVTALRDDGQARLQEGVRLAERGDTAGAIAAHEAALTIDPSIAQAHANLISLYAKQQNWDKAEEHYRAVVALGVNLADAHYDHGVMLGMQDKWPEAAEAYRQAIAVNPRHARAYNNLGQALERVQDVAGAADAYRHAVDNQPSFRVARFNLGRMLIARGNYAEAVRELETLTQPRDAETPRYLFALGTAYVHAGRREEGIKWATDAGALAREFGQYELAAAIDREIARLK